MRDPAPRGGTAYAALQGRRNAELAPELYRAWRGDAPAPAWRELELEQRERWLALASEVRARIAARFAF